MAMQTHVSLWQDSESLGKELKAKAQYIASPALAMSIYLSLSLGRPLFLEGEPGVGKTAVAQALSKLWGGDVIRLQCYEGMDASQVVYEWNYARQAIAVRRAHDGSAVGRDENLFSQEYLLKRPLLRALEGDEVRPCVLLIDELDRADAPIEAMLLEFLSDYSVTIPEIGTITTKHPPAVVITSNRTRDIHDAVKRRSFYHWLDYPNPENEREIILAQMPEIPGILARQLAGFAAEVRMLELQKRPGVAETLDWGRALMLLGQHELTTDNWSQAMATLLKTREDQALVADDKTLFERSQEQATLL